MGTMPRRIDEPVKARAVRRATEHRRECRSLMAAMTAAVRQERVGPELLRRWVRQEEVDAGLRPGVNSVEAEEIRKLKAQNGRFREVVAILRAATTFFAGETRPSTPVIKGFIDAQRAEGHTVESICRDLSERGCQVAVRTYRPWKQGHRRVFTPPVRYPVRR
jgi:transposase-like protein